MKIKEILQRDPGQPLVNKGQARIADKTDAKVLEELKGELETFVCEGQFADGIQRIVSSYLSDVGKTSQKAAWVSGFFGSGKSHFLKMLAHLWQDTQFPDGSTARSLVPYMPDELRALLRELDTAGRREGGLLAAAGSLPSGTTENVRLTVLGVGLRAVGLPEHYPQAQFCLWLHKEGYLDRVKATVKAAGKSWESELNNLYVSAPIARAVLECDPNFAPKEADARKTIRDQFPPQQNDITTADFLFTLKRALTLVGRDGKLPCTVLVLDEVQQYIGDSTERSTLITEVAEAVSKQLDSRVIVVAAGQSALTEVRLLQKLMDRFTIRVPLSDADVETVTRKVLLQKKPTAVAEIQKLLDSNAGEVSRQLQGTRIGERSEDRGIIVDDFPLLPVRRRFWENCFRQIDAAGTKSQLRSQLQIIRDAVAKIADRPLSAVVAADELYESLAPEMVNTGVLLRELNERIINLGKDRSAEGKLASRMCGLVFLIGKLPREGGADIGVRATKEHISDLLIDDLRGDNARLRGDVERTLAKLVSEGVLMRVGDEYRLQTKEGSEWDREFRNSQTKLSNDDTSIQLRRDALLYAEADRIVRGLKVMQGAAKEPRALLIFRDQNPPVVSGDGIPIWIRDAWSCAEKEVVEPARSVGTGGPIIYVFIPRQSADDLRKLAVDSNAAQNTLDAKGAPSSAEGQEARQSMLSRRDLAVRQRDDLVKQIVANAKVFQGGGNELLQATLEEKLREAAEASLIRLFPRFKEADASGPAWEAAIKRAREGADQPFQAVGHAGPTEQHAVCQQVLTTIGAGKTGGEIRKSLRASPYGWPQDAIDASLIALHRSQHITATLNGTPVPLGQLDQNKISKAEFRIEQTTLSVQDRLIIRKLIGSLRIPCKGGEEQIKATEFLSALSTLAGRAGGAPPLPAPPSTVVIDDLKQLVGNEQLAGIREKATELQKLVEEWKKATELAEQRKPLWDIVERMAKHAATVPAAAEPAKQVETIRTERMLLAPTDPVSPIRSALAGQLRQAANDAQAAHEKAYNSGMQTLTTNETWNQVPQAERTKILAEVGLVAPSKPDVSTDEALVSSLDSRPLGARRAEADAVAGRIQRALELAAKYLEPKVRRVSVERATLRNEAEVRGWIKRQEKTLSDAVKQGPIFVD